MIGLLITNRMIGKSLMQMTRKPKQWSKNTSHGKVTLMAKNSIKAKSLSKTKFEMCFLLLFLLLR